jgi:hypothetical protein
MASGESKVRHETQPREELVRLQKTGPILSVSLFPVSNAKLHDGSTRLDRSHWSRNASNANIQLVGASIEIRVAILKDDEGLHR